MALKAVPPREATDAERARYAADLEDMKANPSAWANGPEHVPTTVVQETVTVRQIERPPGVAPSVPKVEAQAPAAPSAPAPRAAPPAPGVTVDAAGRIVPV